MLLFRCSRYRAPADTRSRLQAALSGLGELQLLRQRQEELVRGALEIRWQEEQEEEVQQYEEQQEEVQQEQLLEENILLLRKQLDCLRRRDTGLITQLQELDRQISELRLDTEMSHDLLTDSRPSSGFYDLSDATSCSLSNSSNSVFSECVCPTEADTHFLSAGDPPSCLQCDGLVGGPDSSSSGTVSRSLSAPQPPSLDLLPSSSDSQSKFVCDLVSRTGDLYQYPSPLHAVSLQRPVLLQSLAPETPPPVPQSSSWPSTSTSCSSSKHLDSYILSLLQRRLLLRPGRPRTSISTDASKSLLRPAGLCGRGAAVGGGLRGGAGGTVVSSPHRQLSVGRTEEEKTQLKDQETSQALDLLLQDQTPQSRDAGRSVEGPVGVGGVGAGGAAAGARGARDAGVRGQAHLPPQRQRLCKGVRSMKTGRSSESRSHRRRTRLDDSAPACIPRRPGGGGGGGGRGEAAAPSGSRVRRLPVSTPERQDLDQQTRVRRRSGSRLHHHLLPPPAPPHRRTDRHRPRVPEAPQNEASRGAQRCRKKQVLVQVLVQDLKTLTGSESEYSAECRSLFHSTVMDTSEDERSDFTANRFGDQSSEEEGQEEVQEENSTTSDTGESGGGGARARGRGQVGVRRAGPDVTSAHGKTFVKIKASHNLKKKILRFRSGSLKLMTTV